MARGRADSVWFRINPRGMWLRGRAGGMASGEARSADIIVIPGRRGRRPRRPGSEATKKEKGVAARRHRGISTAKTQSEILQKRKVNHCKNTKRITAKTQNCVETSSVIAYFIGKYRMYYDLVAPRLGAWVGCFVAPACAPSGLSDRG